MSTATDQAPTARRGLPTSYAGHVFRSRLEARFAVLFDTMGLRWEYEPEGFELPSGLYVPDFWLPQVQAWFEVKPDWDDVAEAFQITAELCNATGQQVCVVPGLDAAGWGHPLFHVWRAPLPPRPRPLDGDLGYFAVAGVGFGVQRRISIAVATARDIAGPRLIGHGAAKAGADKAKAATFERPSRIPAYPLVAR